MQQWWWTGAYQYRNSKKKKNSRKLTLLLSNCFDYLQDAQQCSSTVHLNFWMKWRSKAKTTTTDTATTASNTVPYPMFLPYYKQDTCDPVFAPVKETLVGLFVNTVYKNLYGRGCGCNNLLATTTTIPHLRQPTKKKKLIQLQQCMDVPAVLYE